MKWRKVKKRLKKDVIPMMIGTRVVSDGKEIMQIDEVKVRPAGGRNIKYECIGHSLIFPQAQPYVDEIEDAIEEHISENGFEMSFEIPKIDTKNIKKLWQR